ncbi:hypothetical protein PZM52_11010 [Staphylococcus capitis]|nr:hypothetical protein [Staphylococcus capitis]MCC3756517.1 hypothetical protein [Staphylococcus capitis]MDH8730635.1 hypothetical protein [Staphylococcus capitis]MDH9593586.1 hypothetical protein [Staphylococcus capitis]MDH9935990.1 hypothetical protein [Staphylococcus capitis]MDH9957849.1 hypothetical protein [Staphylococcus capitis]
MNQALNNQKEYDHLIKESEEYSLLIDLLSHKVKSRDELISRLAKINKEREIFLADEYYDEINKAVKQNDDINLNNLLKIAKLSELKRFLKDNSGD